jgi:hypothetical protein
MFNLETAISEWRRQMIGTGMKARGVLEELESHLREDVDRRVKSRTTEKEAFEAAVSQLGQSATLTGEFAKIGETNEIFGSIKQFLLTLAGIRNPILATNMNTSSSNSNLEPAWATYVKSGAFALPAAVLWLLVAIFVFPKFNEVVLHSQTATSIPAFFRFGWNLALFLTYYWFIVCGAFVFALALLEWRIEKWRRYRRAACAIGVFLLNSAVLIAITAMVIFSLVILDHHAK